MADASWVAVLHGVPPSAGHRVPSSACQAASFPWAVAAPSSAHSGSSVVGHPGPVEPSFAETDLQQMTALALVRYHRRYKLCYGGEKVENRRWWVCPISGNRGQGTDIKNENLRFKVVPVPHLHELVVVRQLLNEKFATHCKP